MGIEPKTNPLSLVDSASLAPVAPPKNAVIGPGFGLQLDYKGLAHAGLAEASRAS